ncbi:MAG: alpha/beta fold hydrolase [Planctomycetota bacterium]
MKVLFLHGWQSTPGGIKPTFLNDHGHEVLNPALPDDDFDAALRIAQAEFDRHRPDVVVGSSRGGAVAMNIESGSTPLILMCPAWKHWGKARTVKPGTVILHSKADATIPFLDSEELVRDSGLPSGSLIVVGHEHRLADPESLKVMLEVCERARTEDISPDGKTLASGVGDRTIRLWEIASHQSMPKPRKQDK